MSASLFPEVNGSPVLCPPSSVLRPLSPVLCPASSGSPARYRCTSAADCAEANRIRAFVAERGEAGATWAEIADGLAADVSRVVSVCDHLEHDDAVLRSAIVARGAIRTAVVVSADVARKTHGRGGA